MGKNTIRSERASPCYDRFTGGNNRRDLSQWKIGIAKLMARVHDFDADRTGVDVGFSGPHGLPRVPCALFLRHALSDAAVFKYDVMGRNFAFSTGKMLQR